MGHETAYFATTETAPMVVVPFLHGMPNIPDSLYEEVSFPDQYYLFIKFS